MQTFINVVVHNSNVRLKFYGHYQLFRISSLLKTLVLISIFLFWDICQLLYHVSFCIAVRNYVTLNAASKLMNHREISKIVQPCYQ